MLSRFSAEDPPPPQGVDPEIWSSFLKVDTDHSNTITASELRTALMHVRPNWPPFEIDTVKLLMNIFDVDRNGKIDIHEFDGLWKYIKTWEDVFSRFDKNQSDTIDAKELQKALEGFGYNLSSQLQDLLQRKYDVNSASGETPTGVRTGKASSGITFDRFMRACVVVKQLKESFEALDRDAYGRVKIDEDTFLKMVFKLP